MRDSREIDAERTLQHPLRIIPTVQLLTLFLTVVLWGWWLRQQPTREEVGPAFTPIAFQPVALEPAGFGQLRLAGSWEVSSDEPRFGGISGLVAGPGGLTALTDSGVVIRFPRPKMRMGRAELRELPAGPGSGRYKASRDSEAVVRDPSGRGWWIAFENRNQLWLYDQDFRRPLRKLDLGSRRWSRNRGIEGMADKGGRLLLFPEDGRSVVEWAGNRLERHRIVNAKGRISDAAQMPDGRIIILNRNWGVAGFSSSLSLLHPTPAGYRLTGAWPLAVGPLDNLEAIAPERLADGRIRLWLMTDDNFHRPLRTLLVAVDLPQAAG